MPGFIKLTHGSGVGGIVVGRTFLPVVNAGDAICHIGRVAAQGPIPPETTDVVFNEDEII